MHILLQDVLTFLVLPSSEGACSVLGFVLGPGDAGSKHGSRSAQNTQHSLLGDRVWVS